SCLVRCTAPTTTATYTLSLHDALPICRGAQPAQQEQPPGGAVPSTGGRQFGEGGGTRMNYWRHSWVAFCTILIKEIRRFTRIWAQTLLPPGITMALYFVIFGNLIGNRIGDMGGFAYIDYI